MHGDQINFTATTEFFQGGEDTLRSKQINILHWNSKKTPSPYLHSNRRPRVLRCPDPPACLQGASSSSGPWRRRAAGRQVHSVVSSVSLWIFCSGTRPASNRSDGGERGGEGGQTCKLITSHSFGLRFQPERVMSRSPLSPPPAPPLESKIMPRDSDSHSPRFSRADSHYNRQTDL